MKAWRLISLLLLAGLVIGRGAETDATKAQVKACVTALGGPALGSDGEEEESAIWWYRGPGRNRRLQLHIQASADCAVLGVAFEHDSGKLAYGWLPAFAELSANKETVLPPVGKEWKWEGNEMPLDITVLVLASNAPESVELRKLIAAMHVTQETGVLASQTNKLHELVGRIAAAGADKGIKYAATGSVAGVFRNLMERPFDWHDYARTASFSASNPATIVFSNADSLQSKQPSSK